MATKVSKRRWRLELLGVARVIGPAEVSHALEGKTAALLAYLSLEGPTLKAKLAGLLWPESPETTARNNLRQLLRRLRLQLDEELLEGTDPLALRAAIDVDVCELRAAMETGRFDRASALRSELLSGVELGDCEELESWLTHKREQLRRLQQQAVAAELRTLEEAGQLRPALELAQWLADLDPADEPACRKLMRLFHVLGERTGALRAFQRCKRALGEDLGVAPSEETVRLAREMERPVEVRRELPGAAPPVPLALAHPPVLTGRERAWRAMEEAWASRKTMSVASEAGFGKSRLITDFVATKGEILYLAARPGDRHIPFASHTRTFRNLLALRPSLRLEPWMRREVARILPEMGDGSQLPLPRPEEKVRFFEALCELFKTGAHDFAAVVMEDGQYIDALSFEFGAYVITTLVPMIAAGRFPIIINSFRTSELAPGEFETIRQTASAGLTALIEIEPLEPGAVQEMLAGMGHPSPATAAEEMTRYTGGNPLFIVETMKHLWESGRLESSRPPDLLELGDVGEVLHRRLARLSPEALRLARVIAVAQVDFSPVLAAKVLEVAPDLLADPWRELERARILRGEWFSHDLIAQAVLDEVPASIRTTLAARITRCRPAPS